VTDLALTYTQLLAEVGYYLGYGETTGSYTADQTSRADKAVQEGLRMFYYPDDVDGQPFSGWSFMRPIDTVSIQAATQTYDLPVGFESFDGPITFGAASGYPPIQIIGEGNIRAMEWPATWTGIPVYGAVRPKSTTLDSTTVQTMELLLFPTPDITATGTYRYFVKPLILASGALYPMGSAANASTIREAVKAAAELAENDERGIHWETFKERLKTSMRIDRRTGPQWFGRMVDNSYAYTGWESD